jgi:hypothetical protein
VALSAFVGVSLADWAGALVLRVTACELVSVRVLRARASTRSVAAWSSAEDVAGCGGCPWMASATRSGSLVTGALLPLLARWRSPCVMRRPDSLAPQPSMAP